MRLGQRTFRPDNKVDQYTYSYSEHTGNGHKVVYTSHIPAPRFVGVPPPLPDNSTAVTRPVFNW